MSKYAHIISKEIKYDLFRYIFIIGIVGNFLQIVSGFFFAVQFEKFWMSNMLLGIGTFCGWISTLNFLNKSYQNYLYYSII